MSVADGQRQPVLSLSGSLPSWDRRARQDRLLLGQRSEICFLNRCSSRRSVSFSPSFYSCTILFRAQELFLHVLLEADAASEPRNRHEVYRSFLLEHFSRTTLKHWDKEMRLLGAAALRAIVEIDIDELGPKMVDQLVSLLKLSPCRTGS